MLHQDSYEHKKILLHMNREYYERFLELNPSNDMKKLNGAVAFDVNRSSCIVYSCRGAVEKWKNEKMEPKGCMEKKEYEPKSGLGLCKSLM